MAKQRSGYSEIFSWFECGQVSVNYIYILIAQFTFPFPPIFSVYISHVCVCVSVRYDIRLSCGVIIAVRHSKRNSSQSEYLMTKSKVNNKHIEQNSFIEL